MNCALIGCGRIAANHIKAAIGNGLHLSAVCDVKPEAMEALLVKHGLEGDGSIRRYTDYRRMLEENDIRLVAIATESGLHAQIALDCIDRGVHVIIEKPMAMSIPDAEEIIPITEEELEDIFARLHAQFPDLEVYRPADNDLVQQTLVDQIGGNNFGVLLGSSDELKVVNLFETDEYMNFCKRVYNWNQLGYISKDAAADTTNVIVLVKEGVLMAYGTGGKPGSKVQESTGADKDMTIFQTREDYVSSSAVASYPWAIPISTANPEAAMVLMNELYTNPELADLIIYGIEGTHYEITEDGFLDANAGTSPDTFSTLNWLYPNQFASTVIVGNTADLWERTTQFNEEARQSPASGFAFDSTNIATEQTAVTNVYDEYRKSLEFGFVDPEVAIPEMLQKMNSAGLQKIIEEKQAQLDAWAASK